MNEIRFGFVRLNRSSFKKMCDIKSSRTLYDRRRCLRYILVIDKFIDFAFIGRQKRVHIEAFNNRASGVMQYLATLWRRRSIFA